MERYTLPSALLIAAILAHFTSFSTGNSTVLQSDKKEISATIQPVEFYGTYDDVNNLVEIVWSISSGTSAYKFGILKSTDNVSFTEIGEAKSGVTTGSTVTYSLFDELPSSGINYYLLRHTNFDGSFYYIDTISVQVGGETNKSANKDKDNNKMTVYPNPVYDADFSVEFTVAPKETTELIIEDVHGNLIQSITVPQGTKKLTVNSPAEKGNHVIKVVIRGELLWRRVNIK